MSPCPVVKRATVFLFYMYTYEVYPCRLHKLEKPTMEALLLPAFVQCASVRIMRAYNVQCARGARMEPLHSVREGLAEHYTVYYHALDNCKSRVRLVLKVF